MAQFLSTALFLATLATAIGVIVAMLRGHADAIRHALAGRSLRVVAMAERDAAARLESISFVPRRTRSATMSRRSASLRAAA